MERVKGGWGVVKDEEDQGWGRKDEEWPGWDGVNDGEDQGWVSRLGRIKGGEVKDGEDQRWGESRMGRIEGRSRMASIKGGGEGRGWEEGRQTNM